MQIKLFTIPVHLVEEYNEELNKFLRSHIIIDFEKHLQQTGDKLYWCFYIQYQDNKQKNEMKSDNTEKKDYRKILSEPEFNRFSKLRDMRKKIAIEDNIISYYTVFTDAELSEIAKMENPTASNIRTVKGIGEAKTIKYGERILKAFESE